MKTSAVIKYLSRVLPVWALLAAISAAPAATLTYECELQLVTDETGGVLDTWDHAQASDGTILRYLDTAGDKYVSMLLNVPQAGTYQVQVRHRRGPDRAKIKHYIDSVLQGAETDTYASAGDFIWVNLGNKTFTTGGAKILKFEITGKNASSSNYFLYADAVTLTNAIAGPVECETLIMTASSGDQLGPVYNDAEASGGAVQRYLANAAGDYLTYNVDVNETGTYRVRARYRSFTDRATVQHQIDGVNFGPAVDLYQSSAGYKEFDLGEITFATTGTKALRINVTGKNASSTNYFVWPDAVTFSKLTTGEYAYEDNFENEAANTDPSHWIEKNTADVWKVTGAAGVREYRHQQATGSPESWLHVFERNVEYQARFRFTTFDPANAKVRVAVRHNDDEATVFAGYDFNNSKWHIKDRDGVDTAWVIRTESGVETLTANSWHTLKVIARDSRVALYVDDMQNPKLVAYDVGHISPGRVALSALGTDAYFDDIRLKLTSGQGRVEDGVLDYTILPAADPEEVREGVTLFAMNGKLEILGGGERFTSTDNGKTFTGPTSYGTIPDDRNGHTSVLRLNSGKLLMMQGQYLNETPAVTFCARRSTNEGATWDEGGVTWAGHRVGPPDPDEPGKLQGKIVQMNDKLSQMPNGRVFYTVTVRLFDVNNQHVGHMCEVYYSDDDGTTWSKSPGDTSTWGAGEWDRFAEGKVIATATPNKLRLITTWISDDLTPAGTMRYLTSLDNGLTWSNDVALTPFKCARSSFGVDRDLSSGSLVYYMVWVYNDPADHDKLMFPRSRLALVKSTDGENWTYLMDVERWISGNDPSTNPIVQIVDPGITVTPTHLFITMGRSNRDVVGQTHNAQKLRIVRIDKSKLTTRPWPTEY